MNKYNLLVITVYINELIINRTINEMTRILNIHILWIIGYTLNYYNYD